MQSSFIKRIINLPLSKASLLLAAGCATIFSQTAAAEPTGYNQISYSVEASQDVKNDEVTATLYKQIQAKTPKALATELNTSINQALRISKRYPSVTATTGSQNTYPQRDKDGKILGWTGSASVNLKSNDFTAMSELVANLQDTLVVQDLRFGISEEKRDKIEQQLMIDASKDFKKQAQVLATAWDTSGYQVLSVTLNTSGGYPIYSPRIVMASSKMESAPAQNFEGGDSEVKVVANGTIELIPWR